MYRKEINIIRKIVHHIGLIYKVIQDALSIKHKKWISLLRIRVVFLVDSTQTPS
jgi:hypothetical protein